ncbi:MAG: flagellar hook-associated protein FlgL [Proteobacteria bacterium]|nr:flagellar hook-associated protein FlgL [Pseudomonadota bacterium]
MRISSSTVFQQSVTQMNNLMANLAKTQQQTASGNRVLTASDDPAAAAQMLEIGKMQASNKQYTSNRQSAKNTLGLVDGSLTSVSNLLASVKTLAIQAGNAVLDDTQRNGLATQLRGDISQLQALANGTDGTGNYLFAGYQASTQPFTQNPTTGAISYQGDQGQQTIEVAQGQHMATSIPGQTVFGAGDNDAFKSLAALAKQLSTPKAQYPGGNSQFTADLQKSSGQIDGALTRVTTLQTMTGANLNELGALDSAGATLDLTYQQMLANAGQVDIVQAISQLSQQQLALQAAQKSFVQISNLSLFSYM